MTYEQKAKTLALKHSIAVQIAIAGYQIDALPNDVNVDCAFDLADRIVQRMDVEIAELNKQRKEPESDLHDVLAEILAKACR